MALLIGRDDHYSAGAELGGRASAVRSRHGLSKVAIALIAGVAPLFCADRAARADDPWSGFYAGAHIGSAGGRSSWNAHAPGVAEPKTASGSFGLYHAFDPFDGTGSTLSGLQLGYNRLLPSRIMLGIEADASFGSWLNADGYSIGGTSAFVSPATGNASYTETSLALGTLRGRLGYAAGPWLFYATGGLAWSYDKRTLDLKDAGSSEERSVWRAGLTVGGGVEVPIIPGWSGKIEYLYSDFGTSGAVFSSVGQRFDTSTTLQQLRLGLNYRFGHGAEATEGDAKTPASPTRDWFAVHGQTTFVEQAHPAFRSPYVGTNSLPGGPIGKQTWDATLYVGFRLWPGAEFWFNPELDQGFGFANTHGVAGFPNGESFKLGAAIPYTRVQRAFLRQTIDLGGESEKVEADINQFAGTRTADRLVITAGRFNVSDIFDTNKYATNAKTDFLNWSLINTGTFDYAGDGWGYTYGAAAELYWGRWAFRVGLFDLSATPATGNSPLAFGLDPTFSQIQAVGEIEERHTLWNQPGKVRLTGFVSSGKAARYKDAVALATATGEPADTALVRYGYTLRPGVSVSIEQQVSDSIGLFLRAGWADGRIEVWDYTDIDRTIAGGVQVSGKPWSRPDDTVGLAGVINGASSDLVAYLNAGGLGVLVGDGKLPHPSTEKILETYYSYALTKSTRLTADYQFIADPGYNSDRGPVSVFSGRIHTQF